jgi:hypothetical protein
VKGGSVIVVVALPQGVPPPEKNDPPTHPEPLFRLRTLPVADAPVIVIPDGALTQALTVWPQHAEPIGSPRTTRGLAQRKVK